MFGGINNIYMGGYKFSAHCTNISAHKIYSRASLFICGEYFLDRTAILVSFEVTPSAKLPVYPIAIADKKKSSKANLVQLELVAKS